MRTFTQKYYWYTKSKITYSSPGQTRTLSIHFWRSRDNTF